MQTQLSETRARQGSNSSFQWRTFLLSTAAAATLLLGLTLFFAS